MANDRREDSISTIDNNDVDGNTTSDSSITIQTATVTGNMFRDAPIRYLGYANEVGESFRYQYPKNVVPSYIVAFGYCIADAVNTGFKLYSTTASSTGDSNEQQERLRTQRAMVGTMDTLLWQSLASVMIPGYVIHTIVKVTKYGILAHAVPKQIKVPVFIGTWLPTMMGLGAIPFIVHPIDHSVDYFLDNSVRILYRRHLENDQKK